jgi:hypothetical protein
MKKLRKIILETFCEYASTLTLVKDKKMRKEFKNLVQRGRRMNEGTRLTAE